jgi:hypothetical protein
VDRNPPPYPAKPFIGATGEGGGEPCYGAMFWLIRNRLAGS